MAQRIVREYVQRGHIEKTLQEMPTEAKRLKVAAYCRVSTDEAEQFQRLIRDALDGHINLILCKSVSRFARNTVDALSTVRDLREKNVKIFFEKENIDSLDPKCDMILSIYSSLAEEESRSISTNVRWAHNKRVERGEVVFNFKNLYGYTQDEDKTVSILEDEAEVVRDIYHKYIIGYSISELCKYLTEREIKPPQGKRWYFSTLDEILKNEKYAGDVILRKTYQRDFLAGRRVKNTGQAPQKIVENNHPAIIDSATWNAVQAEMERRGNMRTSAETGKVRYDMRYAFSGIIECGECGSTFRRHCHHKRDGTKERVWTCKEHLRGNQYCGQLAIKEEILEQVFVKTFNRLLADRNNALRAVEESIAEAMFESGDGTGTADEIAAVDASIERLQAQMIDLNKKRTRREIDTNEYNTESRKVMDALDALFAERDDLEEAQSTGALSVARRKMISDLLQSEQTQTEFDRDVFSKLIEVVQVYNRDDITFIFRDGTEVKADL